MDQVLAPETAVIIRTRNEEKWLEETLRRLTNQTYQDFEIIIVDSGSTDDTLKIARRHNVTLVEIESETFTYPRALNIGVEHSTAEKYLVLLSAHSLPISNTWLEDGLRGFTRCDNVMGVYGPLLALPDGSFWDKCIYSIMYTRNLIRFGLRDYRVARKGVMGVLGFTNAIVRKDLWEQYHFNEAFAGGGEDGDWVNHWIERGYVVVQEKRFTVRHSHRLSLLGWMKQVKHWSDSSRPQSFEYHNFRGDSSHKVR